MWVFNALFDPHMNFIFFVLWISNEPQIRKNQRTEFRHLDLKDESRDKKKKKQLGYFQKT